MAHWELFNFFCCQVYSNELLLSRNSESFTTLWKLYEDCLVPSSELCSLKNDRIVYSMLRKIIHYNWEATCCLWLNQKFTMTFAICPTRERDYFVKKTFAENSEVKDWNSLFIFFNAENILSKKFHFNKTLSELKNKTNLAYQFITNGIRVARWS